jgi:hypothetical protein
MEELWKCIEGYENYQISNRGRVKNINFRNSGKERMLNPSKTGSGYLDVQLRKDKITYHRTIHTLVWDAFGDKPRNGRILQVDHINNNKTDNRIENLQLLSPRENVSKRSLIKENKTSKYTGVTFDKRRNKWQAQITINGKNNNLGYFPTQEEAAEAYLKAKESL